MELLEFKLTEETETHYFFTLKVETHRLLRKNVVESFDCMRDKNWKQSRFVSNGEGIFWKWVNFDDVINGILSTKNKYYKK